MTQELGITVSKQKNTSEWYSEAVSKAGLAQYSPVKGCMIVEPYGIELWENVKNSLDEKFRKTGVENAYFPMLIPENLLEKESEIVDGFDLEVAWLEQDEEKNQEQRLALRPTSESIITDYLSEKIRSHRQLPLRLNQWTNVVRWEISDTRPFLRTREFLWQEGHTAHETEEEASEEAERRLEQYRELIEEELAIPTVAGMKPEHDKFPGAEYTMTLETLMPDGKSIQSCTSHNLGTHFSEAFGVEFEDSEANKRLVHTTSWGLSTRIIGALVLAHGDDDGLKLPPEIAPVQVVIVPIAGDEERKKILEYAEEINDKLEGVRTEIDDREHRSAGFKFNEWELKGVPLRLEVGPREMESGELSVSMRHTGEERSIDRSKLSEEVDETLETVQREMYEELEQYLERNTRSAESLEEILGVIGRDRGYVRTSWCGNEECEKEVKENVSAEIVVLPFDENEGERKDECSVCGEGASEVAYFAKNY